MRCINCGFISFKTLSKCSNCVTDLQDLPSESPLFNREAFTIFSGPSAPFEESKSSVQAGELFEADATAATKADTPIARVSPTSFEPKDFELDLSDASPLDSSQKAEDELVEAREPVTICIEGEPPTAVSPDTQVTPSSLEQETELDLAGLGFDSHETPSEVGIEDSPEIRLKPSVQSNSSAIKSEDILGELAHDDDILHFDNDVEKFDEFPPKINNSTLSLETDQIAKANGELRIEELEPWLGPEPELEISDNQPVESDAEYRLKTLPAEEESENQRVKPKGKDTTLTMPDDEELEIEIIDDDEEPNN